MRHREAERIGTLIAAMSSSGQLRPTSDVHATISVTGIGNRKTGTFHEQQIDIDIDGLDDPATVDEVYNIVAIAETIRKSIEVGSSIWDTITDGNGDSNGDDNGNGNGDGDDGDGDDVEININLSFDIDVNV